ncbi:Arm DNA-binding domain-containing protein, partial [Mycolicibacter icosiumassiliensis]|uniref:Arm DNA-binding domain-containing protein n=1 Tax=Mycolicibacter icosiumassiliensis TaxID=1792835 RepID=UPI000A8401F0
MATISKYELPRKGKDGKPIEPVVRYRVRYRTPDHRQTDKRGFATKKAAEAFAATVEVSKLKGEYVAPALGKITVGELGPGWLKRQQGVMKPSAYHSIESAWRVHVQPRWARTQIAEIAYSDVQAWITELATKRKATLVITVYSVLARILDDAVRDRRLAANPARGVKLPTRARRKNVYMTADQ